MPPHHVDSTAHKTGEHALFDELRRKVALLREAERLLVDRLEPMLRRCPRILARCQDWRRRVREEMGGVE